MTHILGQDKPPIEEVLAHHGIRGMKWGIVKEDASGAGGSSSKKVTPEVQKQREVAAKKYEALATQHQARIDKLKATPVSKFRQKGVNDQIKFHEDARDIAKKDAQAKREGKLTHGQKTAIKGAVVVVGFLAAYGAYRTLNSGSLRQTIQEGRGFLNKEGIGNWKKNPLLAKKGLSEEELMMKVVKDINPEYGGIGTKMNCRRCTFAYEMRRRGLDVAATRTTKGTGQTAEGVFNALKLSVEDSDLTKSHASFAVSKSGVAESTAFRKIISHGNPLGEHSIIPHENDGHFGESIFRELGKEPDGSRGELAVQWFMGGGHSVAYEIVGGKPVIFDCQTAKKYTNSFDLFPDGLIGNAAFTRLDNLSLNDSYLTRWIKNA